MESKICIDTNFVNVKTFSKYRLAKNLNSIRFMINSLQELKMLLNDFLENINSKICESLNICPCVHMLLTKYPVVKINLIFTMNIGHFSYFK